MTYHQEVILAMELDRRHIGKLVQMITDSWSMTGTLKRVDQHDNREWEIAYPSRQLVPVRGEIYTTLQIGPWTGDVIGNQPVTVETVKGTLEAPETATRALPNLITEEESAEARAVIQGTVVDDRSSPQPREWDGIYHQCSTCLGSIELRALPGCKDPAAHWLEPPSRSGYVVPERAALAMTEPGYLDGAVVDEAPVHRGDDSTFTRTRCGLLIFPLLDVSWRDARVTCRECQAWEGADPLPPEPPVEWHKAEE